jgi:uncharacterized RDD family membrane protein YckC
MKCPKCEYLGFDTGDRCKNCGYDFSLSPATAASAVFDADLFLRPLDDAVPPSTGWDGSFERIRGLEPPAPSAASRIRAETKLPLFLPGHDSDSDEPLIKLPAAPRPPLAVRRTPESPRLRAVPRRTRAVEGEPVLEFADLAPAAPAPVVESAANVRARTAARLAAQSKPLEVSTGGRRIAAAAIDHALLSGVDITVVYLTVRMAELPMSGWAALPLVPLIVFLLLVKMSYFSVFTAVGGQTIGKMAMRIRVVTAEGGPLDAAASAVRSIAGTLSVASFGIGYLPALVGAEHRAIHDRLTRTRVVALPPV